MRKKEKQNAARDKNMGEYMQIESLLDKVRSTGMGGISADDDRAVEKLEAKLAGLEAMQEEMKTVNAYYRKHKTLRGYASLTDEQADAITDPEAFSIKLYGKPYGDFELSSLRGKIKRTQARLDELDKRTEQAQQPAESTKFSGGEIVRNLEADRLQILFDEKPDEETRAALKQNGFRWSPRYSAWQRQLTPNAEAAARRALGLTE